MIKNTLKYLAACMLAVLCGCEDGGMEPPRKVDVDGQFTLDVPAAMQPVTDLHGFAPLQYADLEQGYFLLGLVEPKDSMATMETQYTLRDYAWFVESRLGSSFDTSFVTMRDTLDVNGLPCQMAQLYGVKAHDVGEDEVYYCVSVLEGPQHFYQLIAWTDPAQAEALLAMATDISCSFVETSESAATVTALALP